MTAFDDLLDDFAERIDQLPRPSITALFVACADGLLPEFRRWAVHTGQATEPLAQDALTAGRAYALGGAVPEAEALLGRLEQATPAGDSPDDFPSTAAQDFWICADIAVRVIADPDYQAGSGIEYALEPVVRQATERLYGVSPLGSGPDEDTQTAAVLTEADVRAAVEFCSWAVDFLTERPTLGENELAELASRASDLAPH